MKIKFFKLLCLASLTTTTALSLAAACSNGSASNKSKDDSNSSSNSSLDNNNSQIDNNQNLSKEESYINELANHYFDNLVYLLHPLVSKNKTDENGNEIRDDFSNIPIKELKSDEELKAIKNNLKLELNIESSSKEQINENIKKYELKLLDLFNKAWFERGYNPKNLNPDKILDKFKEEFKFILKNNNKSKEQIDQELQNLDNAINNEDTSVEGGHNWRTQIKNGYNYAISVIESLR